MKLALAQVLLPRCPYMRIDALRPDVDVPDFMRQAHGHDLILQVGEDPRVLGMPDLTLDEAGWSATISIRGARYFVRVAWAAVYGMWVLDAEGETELSVGLRTEAPAAPATTARLGHLRSV